VGATLTLTAGTFAVGANTLNLNGPTLAGTPANLSTTSASNLSFGGAAAGVNLPSSVTQLGNLTINNANGLTLNSSPAVNGVLTFTLGRISTGANKVTVAPGGSVTKVGATSYVFGNLEKTIPAGDSTTVFEIGGNAPANYAPASLTFEGLGVAGTVTATTIAGAHPQLASSRIAAAGGNIVNRYWRFTSTLAAEYDATLSFPATEANGTPFNYIGQRYVAPNWFNTILVTATTTSTALAGLEGFGDIAIGEPLLSDLLLERELIYTREVFD
jgi:hypothetical protein